MMGTMFKIRVVIMLGMVSMGGVVSAGENPKVRQAIEAGNKQFLDALARGDAAAMASLYAESGHVMPPESDVVTGREAIRNFWQGVLDSGVKKATLEAVAVMDSGDFAIEDGRYAMFGADGQKIDSGKYIVVWKREQGKWLLHRDIWNTSLPPTAK